MSRKTKRKPIVACPRPGRGLCDLSMRIRAKRGLEGDEETLTYHVRLSLAVVFPGELSIAVVSGRWPEVGGECLLDLGCHRDGFSNEVVDVNLKESGRSVRAYIAEDERQEEGAREWKWLGGL